MGVIMKMIKQWLTYYKYRTYMDIPLQVRMMVETRAAWRIK